ncbi:protein CEBPZOS-like [Alligator mississippiensis]|uniref:protein CEBPZOS-like n=1 Tax=Alligator mississippiensis TaxID=8496 RepID=UPI0007120D26|nr:protein CEBPZOS-like [Alligator mississippiensis]
MNRFTQNVFRFLVVLNTAVLAATFGTFWQIDRSQDFRRTMHKRFPYMLEAYYKYQEAGGYYGIREKDQMEWFSRKD